MTSNPARSLKESIVIVQPVTSTQNNLRPYIDTCLRQFDSFNIRLALIDSAASYRHVVTEWSEIIGLVKLTEGAITWLALPAFPPPSRRCATGRMQRPSYQRCIGESFTSNTDQGSKTWDAGTNDCHVRFQRRPNAWVNVVPYGLRQLCRKRPKQRVYLHVTSHCSSLERTITQIMLTKTTLDYLSADNQKACPVLRRTSQLR